jgi:hypothetical protein
MVYVKNKNKVVVNINNVAPKRRRRNGLRLSQERIIKHYHFNTPTFNPIGHHNAPSGTRPTIITEKDNEILGLKNELTMRKRMSENHANIVDKLRQTNDDPRENLSSHKNTSVINLKDDMEDVPLTPVTTPPASGLKLKINGEPYKRQPKQPFKK